MEAEMSAHWVIALTGIGGLLALAAGRVAWYEARHWRQAKHLLTEVEAAPEPGRDFYGSMGRADEEAWGGRGPSASYEEWLAEGQEPDWLAQTRADLAPEALNEDGRFVADWTTGAYVPLPPDSGPGVCPPNDDAPGPDPTGSAAGQPDKNVGEGTGLVGFPLAPLPCVAAEPSRLADTGDIMDAALAADVAAYQRAQDDQVRAWCSGWEAERREFTRQLAETWA
jgi:hypothetical protein